MNRHGSIVWLAGAFLLGLLGTGLRYWTVPYGELEGSAGLMVAGFVLVGVAAALPIAFGRVHAAAAFLAASMSVPVAVMMRVMFDVAIDPTSHNLWPFEVALMGFGGAFFAALGTGGAYLLMRFGSAR